MVGVGWQVVVVGDGGRGQDVTQIHKCERLARKCWNNKCGKKIFAGHSARDTSGQSARPLVSKRAALVRDPLWLAAGRLLLKQTLHGSDVCCSNVTSHKCQPFKYLQCHVYFVSQI